MPHGLLDDIFVKPIVDDGLLGDELKKTSPSVPLSPFSSRKSFSVYQIKDQGQPCAQGETSAKTECVPASGEVTGHESTPDKKKPTAEQEEKIRLQLQRHKITPEYALKDKSEVQQLEWMLGVSSEEVREFLRGMVGSKPEASTQKPTPPTLNDQRVARIPRGGWTSDRNARIEKPLKAFSLKPSAKTDSAEAESEGKRALKEQYPSYLPCFHETSISKLNSILKHGLRGSTEGGGESGEDATFFTPGMPSGFVTSDDKVVVKFIMSPRDYDDITPDSMRYNPDNPWADALTQHEGVFASDMVYLGGDIRTDRIASVTVVRNGKPVEMYVPPFKKPQPINADVKASPFHNRKSLFVYSIKDQGQPCKPGETSKTGCIPASGQGSGQTPARDAPASRVERLNATLHNAAAQLVKAGYGVPKEKLARLLARVPAQVKAPVANAWHAVHGVLMAGNHALQALAKEVAKGKGLSDEDVQRLTLTLAAVDLKFQGGMMATAFASAAFAPGLAAAAKAASYMPVASMGYVLHSSAKDPSATAKAAWTLLHDKFPGKVKGAAQFAWGAVRHPLTSAGKHEGKSFTASLTKSSPFTYRTKDKGESYFETCERDEGGQCLPSGEAGREKKPKQKKPKSKKPKPPYSGNSGLVGVAGGGRMPAAVAAQQSKWEKELTPAQREAVEAYTVSGRKGGSHDHLQVDQGLNQKLRFYGNADKLSDHERQVFDNLQAALKDKLPEPITTYRGVQVHGERLNKLLSDMKSLEKNNKPFPFTGMVSTTLSYEVAETYGAGSVLFKITAKTGGYVESIHLKKADEDGHERPAKNQEFLQAHGTEYSVRGIAHSPAGEYVIELEEV